jgi:hypothetical protein
MHLVVLSSWSSSSADLDRTMSSLAPSDRDGVHITVITGIDPSVASRWAQPPVSVSPLTREEMAQLRRRGKKQQSFYEVWRSVQSCRKGDDLLFVRSGVTFHPGWWPKLVAMSALSPGHLRDTNRDEERYILALSTSPVDRPSSGLFVPSSMVAHLQTSLRSAWRMGRCSIFDVWLREWCMVRDVALLCGIPSLVVLPDDALSSGAGHAVSQCLEPL